jgi:cell wall-associated NlpC family hydrolase
MDKEIGCTVFPLIPGRKEPSDKSEMVTQLLFGETYAVLETEKKWILVENHADGYACWIDKKQHVPIAETVNLTDRVGTVTGNLKTEEGDVSIPLGAKVMAGTFQIGQKRFTYEGERAIREANVLDYAKKLLGAPYLWGGKSVFGVDCSGFVQLVFDCCGIQLPRDAYQQAELGEAVDFVDTALAGDIAYFDNEEGRITHVGILTGDGRIIHASGSVRIDTIDHQGIFFQNAYTHQLRIIKRLSGNPATH